MKEAIRAVQSEIGSSPGITLEQWCEKLIDVGLVGELTPKELKAFRQQIRRSKRIVHNELTGYYQLKEVSTVGQNEYLLESAESLLADMLRTFADPDAYSKPSSYEIEEQRKKVQALKKR